MEKLSKMHLSKYYLRILEEFHYMSSYEMTLSAVTHVAHVHREKAMHIAYVIAMTYAMLIMTQW